MQGVDSTLLIANHNGTVSLNKNITNHWYGNGGLAISLFIIAWENIKM